MARGEDTKKPSLSVDSPFKRKVSLAILARRTAGLLQELGHLVALIHIIDDYGTLSKQYFRIFSFFLLATSSAIGAIGMLFLTVICVGVNVVGLYVA